MSNYHIPVMLKEVLELLDIKSNQWYIDCNLGGGGHTEGILKAEGKVIGIDLDADAINEVARNHNLEIIEKNGHLEAYSENLILYQSNFAQIDEVIVNINNVIASEQRGNLVKPQQDSTQLVALNDNRGVSNYKDVKISGILFDLGVSTHQLDEAERGFSFNKDAPLDMRMNKTFGATAADLVNALHEGELSELFLKLGEENFAKPIARKIIEYRKTKLITSTDELARVITSVRRKSPNDRTHPATRVFQALRIAVNDELNSLREALPKALEILNPGGRIAVISFHSLEDRIVKNYFRDWEKESKVKIINKEILEPAEEEINSNPRSRSGKLRIIEKL